MRVSVLVCVSSFGKESSVAVVVRVVVVSRRDRWGRTKLGDSLDSLARSSFAYLVFNVCECGGSVFFCFCSIYLLALS